MDLAQSIVTHLTGTTGHTAAVAGTPPTRSVRDGSAAPTSVRPSVRITSSAHAADRARSQSKIAVLSDPPVRLAGRPRKEVITMGKPSKAALSKAGRKLASGFSSKSTKSKAGATLGKG